jgi:dihydroflavonol-4-reductase
MKIALTGASGHIGANLCRQLIEDNHKVTVLANQFTDSIEGLNVQIVHGNLLDKAALNQLVDGEDIVIHLAATISINGEKANLNETNVLGTKNVLETVKASNVKRLIHFSSIHAYIHEPLNQPLDESRPLAINDTISYNKSKALSHEMVLDAVSEGLDAVIISPTSVMGPNDFKPSLIGQAIIQLYKGKIPALIPGGYDWVDVRDVVQGTIQSFEHGKTGESYLLSGHYASLADLYKKLNLIKGSTKKLPVLPFWLAEIGVPFLKGWALMTGSKPLYTKESVEILKSSHNNISSEKASRELAYSSRPFIETLEDTVLWFKEKDYL